MYSTILFKMSRADHFDLGLINMRRKRFLRFSSYWSLCFKFAVPVTPVQDVSTAFWFRENQRHGTDGQTVGWTTCNV